MARSVPSLPENTPALSSARTSRNPSALPESVVASAFSPRLTPYPLSLWIGEFFRGSLGPKLPQISPTQDRWRRNGQDHSNNSGNGTTNLQSNFVQQERLNVLVADHHPGGAGRRGGTVGWQDEYQNCGPGARRA